MKQTFKHYDQYNRGYNYTQLEVEQIANTVAKTFSIMEDDAFEVMPDNFVEGDQAFDLSLNGEEWEGGSYYIKENVVILASITPQRIVGVIGADLKIAFDASIFDL